jgi:hypothetical protein
MLLDLQAIGSDERAVGSDMQNLRRRNAEVLPRLAAAGATGNP